MPSHRHCGGGLVLGYLPKPPRGGHRVGRFQIGVLELRATAAAERILIEVFSDTPDDNPQEQWEFKVNTLANIIEEEMGLRPKKG